MATAKRSRSFALQSGVAEGARLARWLCTVLERIAVEIDSDPVRAGKMSARVSDAYLALSGGVWLCREKGVDPNRYLRYRLVDAVRLAVETEPALKNSLARVGLAGRAADDGFVTQRTAAVVMTTFSAYDYKGVTRFLENERNADLLCDAVRAVRSRKGRQWLTLLRLVKAMRLRVDGEGAEEAAKNLRRDVLRVRRLLRENLGTTAFPFETAMTFEMDS